MPTTTLLSLALSLAPQQPAPAPATTDVSPAVRATNGLGIALYRALDQEQQGKNLCASPFSIAVALAMVAEGARDETLAELKQALRLPADAPLAGMHRGLQALLARYRDGGGSTDPALREQIAALRQRLDALNAEIEKARTEGDVVEPSATATAQDLAAEINRLLPDVDRYELRIANALWVDRRYPLLRGFVQALDGSYGTGGANSLDIAGSPEAARLRINGWVAQHTEGQIEDLIPPGGITELTRLALGNAVFFRGEWATPFDAADTREEAFLLAGGDRRRARLMHGAQRESVPYAAFTGDGSAFATPLEVPDAPAKQRVTYPGDDGFTMIELPYKGGELAMLVIAPRSQDGLPRIESLLDPTSLASWVGHLQQRKVDIAMLRFDQRSKCELSRALRTVGVRRAFDPDEAQFGGITSDPDPKHDLFFAEMHHETCLRVHEKGTEAAAASVIVATSIGGSLRHMIPFTPVFRADRPFLFVIRDVKSGAILFLGRVVEPGA